MVTYQSALLYQVGRKHGKEEAVKPICLIGQAMLAHPHLHYMPICDKFAIGDLISA